ncbi:MAG: sulfurtransferase TusA family protein [Planctomycetota bacterium]
MRQYDSRGHKCPLPVIRLNQLISQLAPGETVEVIADDPAFELDVQSWCHKTGHLLLDCSADDGGIVAIVQRKGA